MHSFETFAMSVEPWTIKYKPRTSKEVAGNKLAVEKLRDWIESWSKGRPSQAAVLLYGPAGVGKTSVTEALARERGWDQPQSRSRSSSDHPTNNQGHTVSIDLDRQRSVGPKDQTAKRSMSADRTQTIRSTRRSPTPEKYSESRRSES